METLKNNENEDDVWYYNGMCLPRVKKYKPKTKEPNGSELLKIDEIFLSRFHILALIGRGGYGQIYYAIDVLTHMELAIKIEPQTRKGAVTKRMLLEQKILYRLQGRPHVPIMVASGHTDKINFIAMQLLGPNLSDLKKLSPSKRLSHSTVSRIMIQGVAALRDVHMYGYVHRDVKPANMCFGITQMTRHVLKLLDFGLVRRYKNDDGTWRRPRKRPGFRGTLRYVSTRVHDKKEQCPADDLVSMVYSGVELLLSQLPWKNATTHELRGAKEEFEQPNSPYLFFTGPLFSTFAQGVFSLTERDDPDYTALQSLITDMMGGKSMCDAYDWEDDFRNVPLAQKPHEKILTTLGLKKTDDDD